MPQITGLLPSASPRAVIYLWFWAFFTFLLLYSNVLFLTWKSGLHRNLSIIRTNNIVPGSRNNIFCKSWYDINYFHVIVVNFLHLLQTFSKKKSVFLVTKQQRNNFKHKTHKCSVLFWYFCIFEKKQFSSLVMQTCENDRETNFS